MRTADLVTAAQVAARYGVRVSTVHGWCRTGKVAAIKRGRRWVIDATVHAGVATDEARAVTRQAVAEYRRPATATMPAPDAPTEAKVAFKRQMAAVSERRAFALARLRAVGRGDVAGALIADAGNRGCRWSGRRAPA